MISPRHKIKANTPSIKKISRSYKSDLEITDDVPNESGQVPEEIMTKPFDSSKINIIPKQDVLRNLIDRLNHEEIDMNTEFQRHADLWDTVKMSRLIESILIRFPLPAFYFDASNDNKWLIVDGLQRLSSIKKFIENNLVLKELEYLTELNGNSYEQLKRPHIRRIDECPVTLFLIQPDTPDEVKYSVFRRLNTGGLQLNSQEIRNAMATPEVRDYIKKLAQDTNLINTVGDQSKRMNDHELVLRFLAFYHMDYASSKKTITPFLDEMMKYLKKAPAESLEQLEQAYHMALKRSWDLFGETAFEKPESRGKKNSALYEVWTVNLARLKDTEAKKLINAKIKVMKKHDEIIRSNKIYSDAISFSTKNKEYFRIRHERVKKIIQEVLHA